MTAIVITANTDSTQTNITITDMTDWAGIGDDISSLTSITLDLYYNTLTTPYKTYNFTSEELAYYKANGTITLTFLQMFSTLYLDDAFYNIQLTANAEAYISNYAGFGIYADITFAVFNEINSIDTPEAIKFNAEKYCTYAMFLEGMKYLDTTNVNSREVKFNKRLSALNKMLLNL